MLIRQRHPDWPERLAQCLDDARGRYFESGVHDCGLFACSVTEALTGRHPAPWLAEADYATDEELDELLDARGGIEAAVAAAMSEFGATEIPPLMAQRGDWCLMKLGNRHVVGIVAGDGIAAPSLDGLRFAPLRCAVRAWAV
jgi:hypothetical protein